MRPPLSDYQFLLLLRSRDRALDYILHELDRNLLGEAAGSRGPGSTVDIATSYELDGTGIESRWGRDFPHLSRPALGPTQPP